MYFTIFTPFNTIGYWMFLTFLLKWRYELESSSLSKIMANPPLSPYPRHWLSNPSDANAGTSLGIPQNDVRKNSGSIPDGESHFKHISLNLQDISSGIDVSFR